MFKPPHETSIFSAESQAIQNAISHAMTLVSEEILIISDSLSALLALKNPYPKNEIIQSIQEKLSNSGKKIEFLWVPSHIGISGNELADKAANEAITSSSSVLINKITYQDALIKINKLTKSLW
jgi:ribonuclease HI